MILFVSFLALLIASSTEAQRIKGGGGQIIHASPWAQAPVVSVGKGGGVGAVHHTAVVQDPISGSPVVVEKVSTIGSGGIKGLGADSAQIVVSDGPFGQRQLYRVGQSQIPYGLMGSDYYSYPNSLLTAPRALRTKTVVSPNLSGLRPVGYGQRIGGIKGGHSGIKTHPFAAVARPIYRSGISTVPYGLSGLDYYSYPNRPLGFLRSPSKIGGLARGGLAGIGHSLAAPIVQAVSPISQFSVGDAQIKTAALGLRSPLYRSGVSAIPYGLSGLDYFSYPNRPLSLFGGPSKIGGLATGGLAAIGQSPIVQQHVVSPVSQFSVDDAQANILGLRNPLYRTGISSIPYGLSGLDYFSYPNRPLSLYGGSSKIGGLATGGLAGIGQTIVHQDPIEHAIQESLSDPLSQVSVDDGIHQVHETLVHEPLTGEVHRVTEVTNAGNSLAQHNIADAIVQESISSGIGGGYGYSPRISFLSQHPYDAPDTGLLRSVITRPVVQQQQVEQILV